jgi:AcrR family transcriptional regulator
MYKKTTSKETIANALMELCKTKSINTITIQEITGYCGFSRKSFYNNFNNKYDLVLYVFVSNSNR